MSSGYGSTWDAKKEREADAEAKRRRDDEDDRRRRETEEQNRRDAETTALIAIISAG